MGGTTPGHSLPYPTGGDRVSDGDNAIQSLAVKVDAELDKIDQRMRFGAAMKARYTSATVAVAGLAAGASSGPVNVTFPANAGFTSPPVVVITSGSGRVSLAITATTTAGFTYTADNWSPGSAGASTARYVATGPGA
jgi:hypothetical protein